MSRIRLAGVTLALVLMGPTVVSGDVITLTDGSKLIGTVDRMEGDTLILATQFAGTIEIDRSMIATIDTDQPMAVGMDTGDRLIGEIEWKHNIDRAVVQTEMGGVPVEVARIDAIWTKDGKSPETLAMEAQLEAERERIRAQEAKWSAALEFGLLFQEGNTEKIVVRGGAELKRKTPVDMLKFYVSGDYARENRERSASEAKGGAYYEHFLFGDRFFVYARIDLEYDEFEDIDLRVSTGPGIGYYWLKDKPHELKSRAGIGYLHESYRDGSERDTVESELGLDYTLEVTPWLRFFTLNTWYPTFNGLDDYRLVSDNGFVIPIGDSDVWSLKLGALYEYKSIPVGNREPLDQTYYANLLAEFK